MNRSHSRALLSLALLICSAVNSASLLAFTFQYGSDGTILTPIAGDVTEFRFTLDIDATLEPGTFVNPLLAQVTYRVSGMPAENSPSGFENFALVRSIDGATFYEQGGSLEFEIADTAVLDDGVQMAELVGDGIVLTLDAREEGTGRFHPPRLVFLANGTARLQNTNNVPDSATPAPILEGAEYITDIMVDPGNLTLLVSDDDVVPDPADMMGEQPPTMEGSESSGSSSGGGAITLLVFLMSCLYCRRLRPR